MNIQTKWDIYSEVLHSIEFNKSLNKPTKEELEDEINLKYLSFKSLSDSINELSFVKKCKRGVIFAGDDNEITLSKKDVDEITELFNTIESLSTSQNAKELNSSSKKDCLFCKGKPVHIISQEGNNLGETKCPKCSPS